MSIVRRDVRCNWWKRSAFATAAAFAKAHWDAMRDRKAFRKAKERENLDELQDERSGESLIEEVIDTRPRHRTREFRTPIPGCAFMPCSR